MRTPISSPSLTCNQKRNDLLGTTLTKSDAENQWVQSIKDNFFANLGYKSVTKNFGSDLYHVQIYDGNKTDKVLGSYKEMLSYPYIEKQFDIGDYISFDYGGDIHDWLITSWDKSLYYDMHGRIERCNVRLKWKDEKGVHDYPAVVKEQLKTPSFDFNNNIIINQGRLPIVVQYNEFTKLIKINDRFLLGDPYQAFKCTALINYTDTNTLGLELMIDSISSSDDKINGIANANTYNYILSINQGTSLFQNINYQTQLTTTLKLNDEIITLPLKWQSSDPTICSVDNTGNISLLKVGSCTITCSMQDNNNVTTSIAINVVNVVSNVKTNIITPQQTEILQNDEITYQVNCNVSGTINSDIFTVSASGVPSSCYKLTVIDGNSFKIRNLKLYNDGKLHIVCTNNSDDSSVNLDVSLKGIYL